MHVHDAYTCVASSEYRVVYQVRVHACAVLCACMCRCGEGGMGGGLVHAYAGTPACTGAYSHSYERHEVPPLIPP